MTSKNTTQAVHILGALAADLGRAGEDVHAGKASRLARTLADGAFSGAEVLAAVRAMRAPDNIRPRIERAATDLAAHLPALPQGEYEIAVCHVRAGDVITLDGDDIRRTVERAWWVSDTGNHALLFADGLTMFLPSAGVPKAALHERPNFGPFDAVYEVGDRVHVFIGGKEQFGVVEEVTRYGDGPLTIAYTVQCIISGRAYVGPEDMRREPTPRPQIGQVWQTPDGSRRVTLTRVDEHGLTGWGQDSGVARGSIILALPYWQPAASETAAPATETAVPAGWAAHLAAAGISA